MTDLLIWLAGKKTYILCGVIFAATLALVACGRLTPAATMTLLLAAATLLPATFRSALARHQAQELALLSQIAAGGADLAARNLPAALQAGEVAVATGVQLVQQVKQDSQAATPAVAGETPNAG